MALTRDSIIKALVVDNRLSRREATDFVDTFFDSLKKEIESGSRVKLAGFGSFLLKDTSYQRLRRDIDVDKGAIWRIPTFAPSTMLNARIQRGIIEDINMGDEV